MSFLPATLYGSSKTDKRYTKLPTIHRDEGTSNPPATRGTHIRNTALAVLVAAPTILSLVLIVLLIRTNTTQPPTRGWSPSESKMHGFLESMQILDVQFGADERYMSLSHEYDELWATDLRASEARIFHPSLKNDIASGVGVIAMIHQLHCIASLRKALQDASEGKFIGIDRHDNSHWPHCLYYMRSTILCHADITVELPEKAANSSKIVVNGAHDLRSCGNSQKVFEFRDRYRGNGHGNQQVE